VFFLTEEEKINAEVADETRRARRVGRQGAEVEEGSFAALRMTAPGRYPSRLRVNNAALRKRRTQDPGS
jgi:hypothetical protein